jgi:hypothetical protein
MEDGAMRQGMWAAPKAGKSEEMYSLLGPANTLIPAQ